MSRKYGPDHTRAKRETIDRKGEQCEVTGMKDDIEAHHAVGKYLGGPDNTYNYQLLHKDFHKELHDITATDYADLLPKRKQLQSRIIKNPNNEKAREELQGIDNILVREFVHKLLNGFPEDIQEVINQSTLECAFHTIKDLTLTIEQLRAQINAVNKATNHIANGSTRSRRRKKR